MAYERKIDQLRSLLAPADGGETPRDFLDRMRVDLFQDRIYVVSPKGEIVDVPVGGTPLGLCLPGAHRPGSSHPRREGQRAHRGARLPAQEQRNGRDHHRQVAPSLARLAVAAVRLSREPQASQQGARLVPQAERDTEQGRRARDVRSRDTAPGGGQPARPRTAGGAQVAQHRGAARSLGLGRDQPGAGGGRDTAHSARPRASSGACRPGQEPGRSARA